MLLWVFTTAIHRQTVPRPTSCREDCTTLLDMDSAVIATMPYRPSQERFPRRITLELVAVVQTTDPSRLWKNRAAMHTTSSSRRREWRNRVDRDTRNLLPRTILIVSHSKAHELTSQYGVPPLSNSLSFLSTQPLDLSPLSCYLYHWLNKGTTLHFTSRSCVVRDSITRAYSTSMS